MTDIAVGDINGDGRPEIGVTRNPGGNMRFGIYNGSGNGIFEGGDQWGGSRGATSIAFGDTDGDGNDEIAVGRNVGTNMRWALFNSDGSTLFESAKDWGDDRATTTITFGDVDNDGNEEIAVGRNAGSNLRWAIYNGDGTLWCEGGKNWGSDRGTTDLAFGDVDGDGRVELGVTRSSGAGMRWAIYRLPRRPGNQLCESQLVVQGGTNWGLSRSATSIAFGDIDNDGQDEFAISRSPGKNSRVILYDLRSNVGTLEVLLSYGEEWGNDRGATSIALDARTNSLAIGRSRGNNLRWEIVSISTVR